MSEDTNYGCEKGFLRNVDNKDRTTSISFTIYQFQKDRVKLIFAKNNLNGYNVTVGISIAKTNTPRELIREMPYILNEIPKFSPELLEMVRKVVTSHCVNHVKLWRENKMHKSIGADLKRFRAPLQLVLNRLNEGLPL